MQRTMPQLVFLIQVSRPIIWPVLPLVYALGLNASHASVDKVVILQMVMLTFPMNLVGCGLNDIYDFESDHRSPRRRAVWGAVVRAEDRPLVFTAVLAAIPFIVVGACLTRNWNNIIATVSLVLVAWLYSVPPKRLKECPPLDSLANGLGFFLLPFVMGYSLNAEPRNMRCDTTCLPSVCAAYTRWRPPLITKRISPQAIERWPLHLAAPLPRLRSQHF